MKKTISFLFFTFFLLLLTLTVFAQNSLLKVEATIGGQHYTFYNGKDVTTQIELREAKINANNNQIKYIISTKNRIIKNDNLSLWERWFDVDMQEYNRQIKVCEDQNKEYKKQISQLNQVLRRYFKEN